MSVKNTDGDKKTTIITHNENKINNSQNIKTLPTELNKTSESSRINAQINGDNYTGCMGKPQHSARCKLCKGLHNMYDYHKGCSICSTLSHKKDAHKNACKFCGMIDHITEKHNCAICKATGHDFDGVDKYGIPFHKSCNFCLSYFHNSDNHICSICKYLGHTWDSVDINGMYIHEKCLFCGYHNHTTSQHLCIICNQSGHTKQHHQCTYCLGLDHKSSEHVFFNMYPIVIISSPTVQSSSSSLPSTT